MTISTILFTLGMTFVASALLALHYLSATGQLA